MGDHGESMVFSPDNQMKKGEMSPYANMLVQQVKDKRRKANAKKKKRK